MDHGCLGICLRVGKDVCYVAATSCKSDSWRVLKMIDCFFVMHDVERKNEIK